jgi:Leucine-rich repeat (LRR) protein
MKKLLLLLLCIPLIGFGQQTYVPDDNFEQALITLGYDNFLDNYVLTDNINTIQYLQVGGQNISDMTGIEDFIALKWLDCDQNQISSLDVSNNIALQHLGCGCSCSGGNLLTSLDVSQNINLEWLQCQVNNLTSLDVSNNLLLEYLDIGWNPIITIDLSNNTLLKHFGLYNYPLSTLTSIDVTNNPDLEYLNVGNNQITSIDLINNHKITYLSTSGNILQSLDVTNMQSLEVLLCGNFGGGGQITSLDLTNNLLLNRLHCEGNQIAGVLDLSNNPLITWLTCENNQIEVLDISNLSSLTHMTCNNNNLIELNMSNGNNVNFVTSYPANPSASPALDLRNNPNLSCINVDDPTYSINNWIEIDGFYIDPQHYYSNNCLGSTAINEGQIYDRKEVIRITDVLGRETKEIKNEALFYIYDDGTVEKRIIIE